MSATLTPSVTSSPRRRFGTWNLEPDESRGPARRERIVSVGDRVVGEIGQGVLAFVGVEKDDGPVDASYVATKIRDLRIFDDEGDAAGRKRMNRSVVDVAGSVLVVSQFTLAGDVRRGRRPSFDDAAPPDVARATLRGGRARIASVRRCGLRPASSRR